MVRELGIDEGNDWLAEGEDGEETVWQVMYKEGILEGVDIYTPNIDSLEEGANANMERVLKELDKKRARLLEGKELLPQFFKRLKTRVSHTG